MIVAWRLIKKKHQATAFDGEGARRYGGRWNHKGTAVVYISDSLALAALETFVHLPKAGRGLEYVNFRVEIPDDLIEILEKSRLPQNWRQEPPPDEIKQIGTDWVQRRSSAVLRVPSVIVPVESNFILNMSHPDTAKILVQKPEDFSFDPRMWK